LRLLRISRLTCSRVASWNNADLRIGEVVKVLLFDRGVATLFEQLQSIGGGQQSF
jgi:hypothetical protein